MLAVIGGAFYFIMHNNINGIGERYRKNLQAIPVLKLALPSVKDPDDPKYLTDDEIKKKIPGAQGKKTLKCKSSLTTQIKRLPI